MTAGGGGRGGGQSLRTPSAACYSGFSTAGRHASVKQENGGF